MRWPTGDETGFKGRSWTDRVIALIRDPREIPGHFPCDTAKHICEPCSKDKHSTWPFILDFPVSTGSINKFRLFYKRTAVKTHRLRQCPQTNQRIHCIKTHKRLNRNKAVSNHYPTTHLRSLNHAQQPPGGLLILWREIIQHLDSSHSELLLTSQNHTGSWQSKMPGVPN